MIGARRGRLAYLWAGYAAYIIGLSFIFFGHTGAAILPLAYTSLHYAAYRRMVRINKGKALNKVLGLTARNMFIYGLLVAAGFLLG